jgi:hypothetical protein
MKTVPLGGKKAAGRVAQVSDGKFDLVMSRNWFLWEQQRPNGRMDGPYAHTNLRRPDGSRTILRMHNLVTGLPFVDHADGNGLNNQDDNLREADCSLNNANRANVVAWAGGQPTSRYKGVSLAGDRSRKPWRAIITVRKVRTVLGTYWTQEEAALAYDVAAIAAWGEYARLNFPEWKGIIRR